MMYVFCIKTTELSGFLNVCGSNVIALTLWFDVQSSLASCVGSKTSCRKLWMAAKLCGYSEGSKT